MHSLISNSETDRLAWRTLAAQRRALLHQRAAVLSKAILYTTSPGSFDPAGLAQFATLSEKVTMRRFGGDCYTYGLLASGYVDLLVGDEPAPL